MKKLIAVLLCMAMLACFAGCGAQKEGGQLPGSNPTMDNTTPGIDPVLWQDAYLEYVEREIADREMCLFYLIYLNDDEIPELFIQGSCNASGAKICTYYNGEVVVQSFRGLDGVKYIPKSGLIYNCSVNMGYNITDVYLLSGGEYVSQFYGWEEMNVADPAAGSTYYIRKADKTENRVSLAEYEKAISAVFNTKKAQALDYEKEKDMTRYSDLENMLRNWK